MILICYKDIFRTHMKFVSNLYGLLFHLLSFRMWKGFVLLTLFSSLTYSQYVYFGRNKVQYQNFEWHTLSTQHFKIYFYPEMRACRNWCGLCRGSIQAPSAGFRVLANRYCADNFLFNPDTFPANKYNTRINSRCGRRIYRIYQRTCCNSVRWFAGRFQARYQA